jgi:hypothetical protein
VEEKENFSISRTPCQSAAARERERGKRGDQVRGGQVKSKSFEI